MKIWIKLPIKRGTRDALSAQLQLIQNLQEGLGICVELENDKREPVPPKEVADIAETLQAYGLEIFIRNF